MKLKLLIKLLKSFPGLLCVALYLQVMTLTTIFADEISLGRTRSQDDTTEIEVKQDSSGIRLIFSCDAAEEICQDARARLLSFNEKNNPPRTIFKIGNLTLNKGERVKIQNSSLKSIRLKPSKVGTKVIAKFKDNKRLTYSTRTTSNTFSLVFKELKISEPTPLTTTDPLPIAEAGKTFDGINFLKDSSQVIELRFSEKPNFNLRPDNIRGGYLLEISGFNASRSHLLLPYYAPKDFNGLSILHAEQRASNESAESRLAIWLKTEAEFQPKAVVKNNTIQISF